MELQSIQQFNTKFDQMMGIGNKLESNPNQSMFENIMESISSMAKTEETTKTEMANVLMGNSDNAYNALIQGEKMNLEMQYAVAMREKISNGMSNLLNQQI